MGLTPARPSSWSIVSNQPVRLKGRTPDDGQWAEKYGPTPSMAEWALNERATALLQQDPRWHGRQACDSAYVRVRDIGRLPCLRIPTDGGGKLIDTGEDVLVALQQALPTAEWFVTPR